MARPTFESRVNFSDPEATRDFFAEIGAYFDWYEVELNPVKDTRSSRQNRWYWKAICQPFADFLNAQDYVRVTKLRAHLLLKMKVIPVEVCDPRTGEVIDTVPDETHTMSVSEFYNYCEACRVYLAETFHIITRDPGEYGVEAPEREEAHV